MSRDDDTMFNCADCGINTWEIHEYYMVIDKVWKVHGVDMGMLCIGCLEDRMGRRLVPWDFAQVPVNWNLPHQCHSERLLTRLGDNTAPHNHPATVRMQMRQRRDFCAN